MLSECANCIELALQYLMVKDLKWEEKSISNRMKKLGIISQLRI